MGVQVSTRSRTIVRTSAAEARIHADLSLIAERVSAALGANLLGLLLVGGYARGEGSIVMRDGSPHPYNDYDFVVVTRSHERSCRAAINGLSEELGREIGVAVDLHPLCRSRFLRLPPTLFWVDASLGGAEWLVDNDGLARLQRRFAARDVPLEECGRLLANRAVGLALSNLEAEDTDLRRARHGNKAVLACGDAWLLAASGYKGTLAERREALRKLASAPRIGLDLVDAYADAVAFRATPDEWVRRNPDIDAWYSKIRGLVAHHHLTYEGWRVNAPTSPNAFARWRGRLYPRLPDARFGAVPSALKLALQSRSSPLPYRGHPRERLSRAAVLLAYSAELSPQTCAEALGLLGAPSGAEASYANAHAWLVRIGAAAG